MSQESFWEEVERRIDRINELIKSNRLKLAELDRLDEDIEHAMQELEKVRESIINQEKRK